VRKAELELQELRRALDRNEALVAVHYACESFLTAKDRPAGVACVALHDLQTGETLAFSRVRCTARDIRGTPGDPHAGSLLR
jgi:hypothetical protein